MAPRYCAAPPDATGSTAAETKASLEWYSNRTVSAEHWIGKPDHLAEGRYFRTIPDEFFSL